MESYYNLGIVKMTTGESGRGLILKREAAQIALHSGQIKELKFGSELYSENLY